MLNLRQKSPERGLDLAAKRQPGVPGVGLRSGGSHRAHCQHTHTAALAMEPTVSTRKVRAGLAMADIAGTGTEQHHRNIQGLGWIGPGQEYTAVHFWLHPHHSLAAWQQI